MLPEIDGIELVRRVRRESIVPIIMLTARGREPSRIAGLEAGADDYVARPFSLAEVTARMRAQLRRARGFMTEETVLRTGEVELDLGARRCTIDGREVELTRREFDLFGALLRYPGRIHTREQLLGLVWGADDITPKTVDVHVAALRRKLGSAVSIATLRGVGYRLDAAAATGAGAAGVDFGVVAAGLLRCGRGGLDRRAASESPAAPSARPLRASARVRAAAAGPGPP